MSTGGVVTLVLFRQLYISFRFHGCIFPVMPRGHYLLTVSALGLWLLESLLPVFHNCSCALGLHPSFTSGNSRVSFHGHLLVPLFLPGMLLSVSHSQLKLTKKIKKSVAASLSQGSTLLWPAQSSDCNPGHLYHIPMTALW